MSSVPLLGYHSTIPWLPLIRPRSSPRHLFWWRRAPGLVSFQHAWPCPMGSRRKTRPPRSGRLGQPCRRRLSSHPHRGSIHGRRAEESPLSADAGPGSIRCRARPFVVPLCLWPVWTDQDGRLYPRGGWESVEWRLNHHPSRSGGMEEGGRRYWGGIAALISTAIQPRLERAVPVIELGSRLGRVGS
jgi:hypothetical protein